MFSLQRVGKLRRLQVFKPVKFAIYLIVFIVLIIVIVIVFLSDKLRRLQVLKTEKYNCVWRGKVENRIMVLIPARYGIVIRIRIRTRMVHI